MWINSLKTCGTGKGSLTTRLGVAPETVERSRPNVVETGLDTAEGDRGGGGDDDVGEDRAHGADVKSNVQYLARRDKY